MMAAPALMPAKPLGAKPPVAGSFQWLGLVSVTPTAQKNRMIAILSTTIAVLEFALSLMPITRMTVIRATIRKAGRLAMTRKPNRWGAAVSAEARYWLLASVAPCAIASAAMCADRMSVASHAGMATPKWLSSSRK